jgi:hypothetical protein
MLEGPGRPARPGGPAELAAHPGAFPGYVAQTRQGDVIALDVPAWHTSSGGQSADRTGGARWATGIVCVLRYKQHHFAATGYRT